MTTRLKLFFKENIHNRGKQEKTPKAKEGKSYLGLHLCVLHGCRMLVFSLVCFYKLFLKTDKELKKKKKKTNTTQM